MIYTLHYDDCSSGPVETLSDLDWHRTDNGLTHVVVSHNGFELEHWYPVDEFSWRAVYVQTKPVVLTGIPCNPPGSVNSPRS